MTAATRIGLCAAAFAAACTALAACGGSSGAPAGSQRNYVPPTPSPVGATQNVQFTIAVPPAAAPASKRRAASISSGTQSVSITLAALNGQPVPPQTTTTVNVTPGAPGCTESPSGNTCTANVIGAVGVDAFTVLLYSQPNGTGAVLATGTVVATIGGGNPQVGSNDVAVTLNPIIAALQTVVTPASFAVGTPSAGSITAQPVDGSGALILGLTGTVDLSMSGGGTAVGFGKKKTQSTKIGLSQTAAFNYNGSPNVGQALTLSASLEGSSPLLTSNATIPFVSPPTPSPSPTPVGLAPAIYVLNQGASGGTGATVTVYPLAANGNAAPIRTLQLSANKAALSIAVDDGGQLRVGYNDGSIAAYAYNANGTDKPAGVLRPTSQTNPAPVSMTIGQNKELITIGTTSVSGIPAGSYAALVYGANESGPADPLNAWNFTSPSISLSGESNSSVAGLAMDSAGNYYVDGALRQSILASAPGIYIAPSTATGPNVIASRTIPGNATTNIPATPQDGTIAGLALDSGGQIYESQYGNAQNTLPGAINIFAAGAGGGTTSVPPLTTITGTPLNVVVGQGTAALPIAVDANQIYVTNGSLNSVFVYAIPPPSGNISPNPLQTITGSSTGLNAPIGIAVGLSGSGNP